MVTSKQSKAEELMDRAMVLSDLAVSVTTKLTIRINELEKERDMYKEDFEDLWHNVNNMKLRDRLRFLIKGAK